MSWLCTLPGRTLAAFATAFVWIYAGMGLRIWFGGKHYLARLFGDEALAQRAFDRLSGPDAPTVMLGESSVGAGGLLALASLALALVLVLCVLVPTYLGLKLAKRSDVRVQGLAYFAMSSVATAALLLSVHPILNFKAVPEGPRTFLNYAFEAAGYGWTNSLAYAGAWLCSGVFFGLGLRRQAEVHVTRPGGPGAGVESASATASGDAAVQAILTVPIER